MKIHGLIVAVVVALLIGAAFLPVAHSTMNHDGLVVSVSIAGEREIKKSVSIESVKSLSCMLAELHNHPDAFDAYLPILLQELEADGLIEDAHRIEELIVNAVKKPGLVPSGNLFLNVCCFMVGHSTNSGVLRLSELIILGLLKILFWPTIYIPILNNITLFLLTVLVCSMLYSPALHLPVGVWDIGWEGTISTYGLMGHRTAEIHGGKFGRQCLIFGFRGLSLTLPMDNGYTENWLIGSARAITVALPQTSRL